MLNKIKNLPLFYKIYFIAVAVFVVLLCVFLVLLNGFISDYNKGIPETVSEQFFQNTFVKLDAEKIIEMSGLEPCEFETAEDVKAFVEDKLSSNLTYTSISSTGDNKNYIVKSGDYKYASFSLSKDKNDDYYPSSVELHLPKENKVSCKILNTSTLYINGKAVDKKYVTATEEYTPAQHLPDGVERPEWLIYNVDGLTKAPDINVTDRNGNKPTLEEVDGIMCEQIVYDEQEPEIVDRIVKGAKQYAICMQSDASKSSVYPYFEKGTELYDSIRTVENMFVWDHSGYAIEDEKISEYYRYDENTVSLRVAFTHVLKKAGREDYRDYTDITYYARNIDGVYMIFARHNNV